ncbi:MAG: TlyA family RNA methyltransferase [Arcobacteraceae bacterium]|nr:TlyA family RNA methyltransferase [Arcobacteraceae bacterium]
MRLDIYLTTFNDIQSRNKASELIKNKKIKIDGVIITKPSFKVEDSMNIEILEDQFYVSRSAYKLKYFLYEIDIDIKNKDCLDVGSSTGGFTQILLQNDPKSLSCVDVGSNQLHKIIKDDNRLNIFENTDIRKFRSTSKFDIITCDVSFISILNIIKDIDKLAKKDIIILYKPQYEVGVNIKRNRAGVVQDKQAVKIQRDKFISVVFNLGWDLKHSSLSKVAGKEGNIEELFYFQKTNSLNSY